MDRQQITPASNLAYLREHQSQLRHTYPSTDLSEVSFNTEQTVFPGSRHSSLNTEPLTLDAEQIHDAKDFGGKSEEIPTEETEARLIAKQINDLVEKAQVVVEANEKQSQAIGKIPGTPDSPDEDVRDSIPVPLEEVKEDATSSSSKVVKGSTSISSEEVKGTTILAEDVKSSIRVPPEDVEGTIPLLPEDVLETTSHSLEDVKQKTE